MIGYKKVPIFLYLFLIVILFLGFCSFVTEVRAEGNDQDEQEKEDNPFLNRKQELRYEDEPERTLGGMNLSAILYSGESSRAIVNGYIVEIGDFLDNMEVVGIKSEKVVFKDYLGKEYVLKMGSVLTAIDNDSSDSNSSGSGSANGMPAQ
ncbi:MAG: hypothetical protein K9L86_01775 [Candidatus Omnitrophica bacterium]|nr:hypothetical protein [Candidatus Omnitrophota bacterium]